MGVRRPRCSAINHKTHRSRPNHCSPQEFGLGRQTLKVRTGAFEVEREGGGGPNLYLAGARVGGFWCTPDTSLMDPVLLASWSGKPSCIATCAIG